MVGREVHDEAGEAGRAEAGDGRGAGAVLGADEGGIERPGLEIGGERKVRRAAEARVGIRDGLPGKRPARNGDEARLGMAEDEPDELAAGEAGAVEDRNPRHGCASVASRPKPSPAGVSKRAIRAATSAARRSGSVRALTAATPSVFWT